MKRLQYDKLMDGCFENHMKNSLLIGECTDCPFTCINQFKPATLSVPTRTWISNFMVFLIGGERRLFILLILVELLTITFTHYY